METVFSNTVNRAVRLKILLLMLPVVLVFAPGLASADLGWLSEIDRCEQLAVGITKHLGRISDFRKMTAEERGELTVVLHVACGK